MKWVLLVVGALVVLVVVIATVGALLPRNHTASRTLHISHTPEEIWRVVTRLANASSVPVDVIENHPPNRLVTRVKEAEKNFGGTWTIEITPAPTRPTISAGASDLTITEVGWVANPIFRFMSRFVMGHHATMDALLKSVAREFNEKPALSGE